MLLSNRTLSSVLPIIKKGHKTEIFMMTNENLNMFYILRDDGQIVTHLILSFMNPNGSHSTTIECWGPLLTQSFPLTWIRSDPRARVKGSKDGNRTKSSS